MCGIAGIIQPGPSSFDQQQLNAMMNALSHRGPDAEGCWQNNAKEAALVHRRLSVIDLSEEACQPFHYLDRYTVIHNGEIYNYRELRKELEEQGFRFKSQSDTEVIAAAYAMWKDESLSHFDGMFAFTIWDEQEKELFAARDRFGEKPFFYHFDGHRFFFGSEMKAIWAAGVNREPNQKMLFNFITIGYTDNPDDPAETFFNGIKKLPAASCLLIRPGIPPTVKKYWDLNPEKTDNRINDKDAIEKFNWLFKTSVARRLRSDVMLGSSLSGGIDSSAVLAEILDNGIDPGDFNAFTAVFPGFEKNEYNYAKLIAESRGVKHHTINVTTENFPEEWELMMKFQEEPAGSASVYPQFKVFQLAARHGVKVLLDGQGADEILAGYNKYYKWFWQELFRKGKLYRSGELKAARRAGVTERFGPLNMIASIFPDSASVILEKQYLLKALRHEDLTPDFIRQQSGEAYYATPPYFSLNGVLYYNTMVHGLEELLRYADRNAMAHGREIRLPFLSHELVEFIFSLPATMKIREGRTKWVLRQAMKGRLPESVLYRDKIGFEPPQQKWMADNNVQQMIREAKSLLAEKQILKKEAVDKPLIARSAFDADNFDWRYLSAVCLFK